MNIFLTTWEKIYSWAKSASLSPVLFSDSCCGAEFISAITSDTSITNSGTEIMVTNPKHADLLIVAGIITHKSAPVLLSLYEQMPEPKYVLAMGACACSGGMYANDSYSVINGADKIIPVDVYLPMCPPRPEAFFDALNKLRRKIKNEPLAERNKRINSYGTTLKYSKKKDILVYERNNGK